jgi:hypothetical protein
MTYQKAIAPLKVLSTELRQIKNDLYRSRLASTVYAKDRTTAYWLYPDLVSADERFSLCRYCYECVQRNTVPQPSIASGLDRGSRLHEYNLESLNFLQEAMLCQSKCFLHLVKLATPIAIEDPYQPIRALRGQTVMIELDRKLEQPTLPDIRRHNISQLVRFVFYGSEMHWNHFRLNCKLMSLCQVSIDRIRAWALVLKCTSPLCKSINLD